MLHITNGDMAANLLRQCGLDGDVLPWREMWIDGPARIQWDAAEAVEERAVYFEQTLGIPKETFQRISMDQLASLTAAADAEEPVVLWFEYDLFDQTMLASLLNWFHRRKTAGAPVGRLEWIVVSSYSGHDDFRGLGELSPEQLQTLWPQRAVVGNADIAFAAEAWQCFASIDPQLLEKWLVKRAPSETAQMMAQAMRFHLRRFPSIRNGLGAVERETLSLLCHGPARPDELFRRIGDAFPIYGLGDLSYWSYLKRMESAGMLVIQGDQPLPGFKSVGPPDFDMWLVILAAYGTRLLAGQSDLLRDGRHAERWLGGVRIDSGATKAWRCAGGDREGGGASMIFM
ncbi:DUF1835 domain-containing protein [uncultured Paenibacillus sp.]|uniref:DUF1835 domain-containing protein n=1 Tax=uncultured Paenibacillus sp. TaxID=227322 RepID=UPI0028D1E602|nr:DUF1835 domain-containing protein [uncultured Paenibacillus sp.]